MQNGTEASLTESAAASTRSLIPGEETLSARVSSTAGGGEGGDRGERKAHFTPQPRSPPCCFYQTRFFSAKAEEGICCTLFWQREGSTDGFSSPTGSQRRRSGWHRLLSPCQGSAWMAEVDL